MDVKKSVGTVVGVLEGLSSLFGQDKDLQQMTLEDLALDDLQKEKTRLELDERKMIRRVEELEAQKRQLFEEGTREASNRKQVILARKIKELDAQVHNLDKNLQFFSRQLRVLNGFVQLKENERILHESGISKLITGVDLQTLQTYVDRATVDGVFHMDKFQDILSVMEESYAVAGGFMEEEDIMEIVRQMQQVAESGEPTPTVVEEGLGRVDESLKSREMEAEEQALY
jgi:hypothetical protein